MQPLDVLVVDDELPIREELQYLLGRDPRIGRVTTAASGGDALRELDRADVDALFLDIAMPGLSGLDVARALHRLKNAPQVVFVTAHEEYAVSAFEVNAIDYLLKPVREARVAEAVRRIVEAHDKPTDDVDDETISVELGGVTRFVSRNDVQFAEAQGDYARLHTSTGNHLLRTPLTTLERRWRQAGFVRIHRSLLVSLSHVSEVRIEQGRCTVVVGATELQVSRRHTAEFREVLAGRSRGEVRAGPP